MDALLVWQGVRTATGSVAPFELMSYGTCFCFAASMGDPSSFSETARDDCLAGGGDAFLAHMSV
jgi:hypothetical protein